ncbi:MAG: chemotaxis protein CheX, partial [Nanoarchaeota archaeon]
MKLTEQEKKVLGDICMSSSQNAGNALKTMINKAVNVEFLNMDLRTESIEKMSKNALMGIADLSGDLGGTMVVSYSTEEGLKLVDLMMMQPVNTLQAITEDARSAFTEFINIIGGAFLNSMAERLNFRLAPNPPQYIGTVDDLRADIALRISDHAD